MNEPNPAEPQPTIIKPSKPRKSNRTRKVAVPKPLFFEFYSNRIMALLLSPRKLFNFFKYLRRKREEIINFLPIQLDIEPVSRCNFHCTMCQVSDWPKFKRAEDMSFEDFKKVIDANYGLVEVKLQGLGEPLMARDPFFEMIKYVRKQFIWVRMTTNASLLHLNDNYKKLIDSGVNEVQISFDGATKEVFEGIRRGSKFEKVAENCKLINQYCESKGLLRTRMWVLIQEDNKHQFADFIPLAKELGFKRLTFSLNVHGWGIDEWTEKNNPLDAEQDVSDDLANSVVQRGAEMGVEVTYWRATSKYSIKSKETICQWPFERAYVSSDLRIVPCCTIANPDVSELGSANDFATLWNSETYREFRRAHLNGDIPKPCRMCYEEYQEGASVEEPKEELVKIGDNRTNQEEARP